MAFSILTLSIESHYAECRDYLNVMLSAVMLSAVMLNPVVLSVVMLNAVMLNDYQHSVLIDVMLNVYTLTLIFTVLIAALVTSQAQW
jgi:hypothetical protein